MSQLDLRKNRMFLKYGHDCDFAYDLDVVPQFIPGRGICTRIRRFFTRLRMVSAVNRGDKYVLRSQGAIAQEKTRHLSSYPCVIHPFSDARKYWEVFMIGTFFIQFVMIPLDLAFVHNNISTFQRSFSWNLARLLFDCFCLIDVFVTFSTGWYDDIKKVVILKPTVIAMQVQNYMLVKTFIVCFCRHYLRTYFLADVFSSIPTNFVFLVGTFHISERLLTILQIASVLKMLRVLSFSRYCTHVSAIYHVSFNTLNITMMAIFLGIYIHFMCCCFLYMYSLNMNFDVNNISSNFIKNVTAGYQMYTTFLYQAALVTCNSGYGVPMNQMKRATVTFFWIISRIIMVIFIARMTEVIKSKNSSRHQYVEMVRQLREYMRHRQLPEYMQRRLLVYYEFRFQKSYFRESEILNTISGQLRQEIVMHSCRQLVENVGFFKNLPIALLVRIVSCLRSEVYLVNDVIIKANTPGDSMFFIASGTVAIYTTSGREICHLEDGSHFGEIALVMSDELRVASVISVEVCELYRLDRKDFVRAIHPYPDLLDNIQKIATDRMEKTSILDEHNRREMASKRLY